MSLVSIVSQRHRKNSLSEQFLVLLGPSVLNLPTFLTLSGASQAPACLPAGLPLSSPISAADGRIHSPVVAASTFPVSRRSDGLSHIALPGSDSHCMPQGQGWLGRNHGDTCLLIWLLWSLFSQRPCHRGSPQSTERELGCAFWHCSRGRNIRRHWRAL